MPETGSASGKSTSSSDKTLWYVIGGVVVIAAVGGAIYFLGGKSESADKGARKGETGAEKPAAAAGPRAGATAGAASGGGASEAEGDEEEGEEEEGEEEGVGVGKAMLLTLLAELKDAIQAKSTALQSMVESGVLDRSEFETNLQAAIPELEKELHDRHGVDESAVLEAQEALQGDPDVKAASRALREAAMPPLARKAFEDLESMVTTAGTVPEGTTVEDVVRMIGLNADITIRKMNEVADEIKAKGKTGFDALREWQETFLSRARDLTESTFAEIGISPADFNACLERFAEEKEVQSAQENVHVRLMMQQQVLALNLAGADAMRAMMAEG